MNNYFTKKPIIWNDLTWNYSINRLFNFTPARSLPMPLLPHFRQIDSFAGQFFDKCFGPKHLWHLSSLEFLLLRSSILVLTLYVAFPFILALMRSTDFPPVFKNSCCFLTVSPCRTKFIGSNRLPCNCSFFDKFLFRIPTTIRSRMSFSRRVFPMFC